MRIQQVAHKCSYLVVFISPLLWLWDRMSRTQGANEWTRSIKRKMIVKNKFTSISVFTNYQYVFVISKTEETKILSFSVILMVKHFFPSFLSLFEWFGSDIHHHGSSSVFQWKQHSPESITYRLALISITMQLKILQILKETKHEKKSDLSTKKQWTHKDEISETRESLGIWVIVLFVTVHSGEHCFVFLFLHFLFHCFMHAYKIELSLYNYVMIASIVDANGYLSIHSAFWYLCTYLYIFYFNCRKMIGFESGVWVTFVWVCIWLTNKNIAHYICTLLFMACSFKINAFHTVVWVRDGNWDSDDRPLLPLTIFKTAVFI